MSGSGRGRSCWCLSEINFEVLIGGRMIRTFQNGEVTSMSDSLLQLSHCQFSVSTLSKRTVSTYFSESEAHVGASALLI